MNENLDLLKALAARLIPASAEYGVPGADDPEIFVGIAAALAPNMDAIARPLRDLGAEAVAGEPLDALMGRLGAAFGLIAVAVIQAYYRDDRVMRALDLEPRPPFPKGYVIPEGDFTLVDPVRARGRIWRDAP